jgi:hypothetical protein
MASLVSCAHFPKRGSLHVHIVTELVELFILPMLLPQPPMHYGSAQLPPMQGRKVACAGCHGKWIFHFLNETETFLKNGG